MSEHDDLEKLLRIKKYETPGEEYFENFVSEFRARRDRESLHNPTSFSLMKRRTADWFDDLGPAKWAVPAGSFATVLVAFFAIQSASREKQISDNKPPVESNKESNPTNPVFELQIPTAPDGAATEIQNDKVMPATFQGSSATSN